MYKQFYYKNNLFRLEIEKERKRDENKKREIYLAVKIKTLMEKYKNSS